jgi:hypothetical protein
MTIPVFREEDDGADLFPARQAVCFSQPKRRMSHANNRLTLDLRGGRCRRLHGYFLDWLL